MSKLRKQEILNLLNNKSTLVRKFDRMYGTYFFIIDSNSNCIYNINKTDCKSIANMVDIKKNMLDANTFEFTYNQ